MMRIAFPPYFHKIYKFPPISAKFTFFGLIYGFWLPPILTMMYHILDAPLWHSKKQYSARTSLIWPVVLKRFSSEPRCAKGSFWFPHEFPKIQYNTISCIADDKNKVRGVSADRAATETYYMMGIIKNLE